METLSSIWPFALSAISVAVGAKGLIRGWRIGYRDRLDLVTDWDRRPLPNAPKFAKAFSSVFIVFSAALLLVPILLLFGMNSITGSAAVIVILWYWLFAVDSIAGWSRETKVSK